MSYDSKTTSEKEFGYHYDELFKDPVREPGDEYQSAKYVLSTLNRDYATTKREERKSSNFTTIVAALAIGVTSIGAVTYTMVSKNNTGDATTDSQYVISLPSSLGEITSMVLLKDGLNFASAIYQNEETYYIDSLPLFDGEYTLDVAGSAGKTYQDSFSVQGDRGEILIESTLSEAHYYSVVFESGNLEGYSSFETLIFEDSASSVTYEDGTCIAAGDKITGISLELPEAYQEWDEGSVVTYGSYQLSNGETVHIPLVGCNIA